VQRPRLATHAPAGFAAAVRRSLASPPDGVDPWFLGYCGALASHNGLRTYVRAAWQLIALIGGVENRDVLDAGSGFGVGANLLAQWGARRVYAVELQRRMIESHACMLARDFAHVHNVHPIRADVGALPIGDRTIDVLVSVEAISHYLNVEAFLDACARVLRPRGALLISDANNGANPRIRARTEEIWNRWENGPHGRIEDHEIRETFSQRRARLIRSRFPYLSEDDVRAYAAGTAGFDRARIEAAILAHRAGGPSPAAFYRRGDLARDPESGTVAERLFDPLQLGRDIEQRGFTVRVLPHFGGARNDLLLAANAVLRVVSGFRFARAFRIAAIKR
jgi:SAM-dependent methyltransferase